MGANERLSAPATLLRFPGSTLGWYGGFAVPAGAIAVADNDDLDRLYWRETSNLSALSADELTARLKEHVGGGLVFPTVAEIARECVRRARQAEAAELAALGLLEELRRLTGGLEPVAATPCEAQRATAQPTKNRDVGR